MVAKEISSFLTSFFPDGPGTQRWLQTPNRKPKMIGLDGSNIPHPSDLQTHFFTDFSSDQKHRIPGCFAQAVRDGRFSAASRIEQLACGTVRSAVDGIG
jgi:hypothetical protein